MIVNGNHAALKEGMTLKDYLESAGCDISAIAVGKNDVIIPRAAFASEILRDSDTLEIVRMVGGG